MAQIFEPLQQAVLTIAGCALYAVLLPDGQPAIAFAALCEALSLDSNGQLRRIRTHPVLGEAFVLAQLDTAGGSQVANVLIAWGIPLWLAGIRLASVKPSARQRLIVFQKEIVATLYGHFFSPTIAIPKPPPVSSPQRALHAAFAALEEALEVDAQTVNERLASLEAEVGAMRAAERKGNMQERLLAATIERLLEHERRLNRLKPGAAPVKRRLARPAQRRKRRRFGSGD